MRYATLLFPLIALALAAATTSTSQPASRPAVDRSSPEKTWTAICNALKDGDLAGFRAGFYNRNELSQLFMDAYSDATVASFDLATAAATLGNDGKEFAKTLATVYTDLVKTGENHTTETSGEITRWVHEEKTARGNVQEVIYFRRFKGEWLVDTARTYALDSDTGRDGAEKLIETMPKVTADIKNVTADIRNGKITTVEQMRARLKK